METNICFSNNFRCGLCKIDMGCSYQLAVIDNCGLLAALIDFFVGGVINNLFIFFGISFKIDAISWLFFMCSVTGIISYYNKQAVKNYINFLKSNL